MVAWISLCPIHVVSVSRFSVYLFFQGCEEVHGIKKWKFWDFQAVYSTVVPWLLAGAPPSVGLFKGRRHSGEGSSRSGSGFSCCVNGGWFGFPLHRFHTQHSQHA